MARKIRRHNIEFTEELGKCTLPQILARQAQMLGSSEIAIREKAYGIWQRYTWKDYLEYVKYTALGLISLGLKRNDNVGIIMDNHPEWLFSEIGSQAAGAVSLNLFTSAVTAELVGALARIHASFVIAQDQEQVDKLIERKEDLPQLIRIIYVDPTGMRNYTDNNWLLSFKELLEIGRKYDTANPGLFESELEKGRPDETALMIMTSGTTGIAKLAMLTHRNLSSMAKKWLATEPIGIGDNWMSMSPPAWIVDQMWGVGVTLVGGMIMNFPETIDTIVEDFREIGPSFIITSSRFWEDLASKIRVKMDDAGFINRKLFSLSEKIGSAMVACEALRKPAPVYLKVLNTLASLIIFRPLLDRVGCSGFVSAFTGGHPISPDVIRFFRAVGVNLKQCYGLTETCGIFQIQPDNEVKLETVGKALPGIDVKISDDQEVMVLSDITFAGYYNDYEATDAAFNDGWLLTGDAGYFDDEGHLLIIGRKQDIIRDKKGNAFSPDFIETRLKFSLYIKEAVTFGEARPYITALINIDMGNVGNWAEERMIPYTTYTDLSQISQVEELILSEVKEVNTQLPEPMRIRRFILLYKLLDADDEELTRTGKVRRRFVYGLYLDLIDAMYTGKDRMEVEGKVRYRDGHVGMIQTTVNVITVD
ncbi:MAG TPA: long-chain fatty acid--CoA ligase [Deltaproteobacteria bacterium]|nr:long-chain fatty acid--CoA ligase [Deltaproteobacteria bacterium]